MRFIAHSAQDTKAMLSDMGKCQLQELFNDIPDTIKLQDNLNIPVALSEIELNKTAKQMAGKNHTLEDNICFLGAGAYDHYVPAVIDHIVSRQEFLTAYTPYQPEISQGTLQSIFEFQTMICQLTDMEVANASMYDGASALAEAAILACSHTKRKDIVVASTIHPESQQVLATYAKSRGFNIKVVGAKDGQVNLTELRETVSKDTAAVIAQNPNFFGSIEKMTEISDIAHAHKALFIASVNPIALSLLQTPGEFNADIAVGDGQSLGNGLNYGGPYFGFFATKKKLMRKIPGRIVGQTQDNKGNRGFVLTLQAREQHIRREKATSNICSNHSLNALIATIYLSIMGKHGIKEVANQALQKAHYTYNELLKTGLFSPVFTAPFFNEFVVKSALPLELLNQKLLEKGIIGGLHLSRFYPQYKDHWLLAVTEKRTTADIDRLINVIKEVAQND